MLSIRTTASMRRALSGQLDPTLKGALSRRFEQLPGDYDLSELGCFVIMQPGDLLTAIEAELGFSPLVNFVDGTRYGNPAFAPSWEFIEDHGVWFELVFVVGAEFGAVLFVSDSDVIDPALLALCRSHGRPTGRKPA